VKNPLIYCIKKVLSPELPLKATEQGKTHLFTVGFIFQFTGELKYFFEAKRNKNTEASFAIQIKPIIPEILKKMTVFRHL
jgi:hypothetical protein